MDRLNLPKDEGVKLQGCLNDCTEYRQNTKTDYSLIKKEGYKANGNDGVSKATALGARVLQTRFNL